MAPPARHTTRARPLSPGTVARIGRLRGAGYSYQAIAAKLKVSAASVGRVLAARALLPVCGHPLLGPASRGSVDVDPADVREAVAQELIKWRKWYRRWRGSAAYQRVNHERKLRMNDIEDFTSNQLRDELSRRAAASADGRCWYCRHSLLTHTCKHAERERKFGPWEFEAPHYIDSEDCMGRPEKYWKTCARHRDSGKYVIGTGDTVDEATRACIDNTKKKEAVVS